MSWKFAAAILYAGVVILPSCITEDTCNSVSPAQCSCKPRYHDAENTIQNAAMSQGLGRSGLMCNASHRTAILDNFPALTQELHLTDGQFGALVDVPLMANLIDLYLPNNNIRYIGDGVFQHVENLQKLILAHNRLSGIGEYTFVGLEQLTFLDVSSNALYEIPKDVFCFKTVPSLQHLILANSHIYTVSADAIKGLDQLTFVNISHNHLQIVPNLAAAPNLVELDLSYNLIVDLPLQPFQALNGLKVLILDHNNIETINNGTLMGLQSLESLSLANNQLVTLAEQPFRFTPELEMLDLSSNLLSALRKSDILMLHSLQSLMVHSNSWTCDCGAAWLRDAGDVVWQHNLPDKMKCSSPLSLRSRSLHELDRAALGCTASPASSTPTHQSAGLAVGIIAAVVLVVVAIAFLYRYLCRRTRFRFAGSPSSSSPYSRALFENVDSNI